MSKKGEEKVVLSTELAAPGQFNVPQIIEALEAEIKTLSHISDSKYATSGTLDGFGDIKKETKVANLIKAYSSVMGRKAGYDAAAADLGEKAYPEFDLGGGTAAQWKKDIQLRINIINHKEKLDKLNYFKEQSAKFLSEEDQKAMLFAEMAAYLQK